MKIIENKNKKYYCDVLACSKEVDVSQLLSMKHGRIVLYFCSEHCKMKFINSEIFRKNYIFS